MNIKQSLLLVAFMLCFVTNIFAQRPSYRIESGYGLTAGASLFNISTDSFESSAGVGFTGGIHVKGGIEHKWYDVSFGLQFYANNFTVAGTDLSAQAVDIEYKLQGAQIFFLGHYKLLHDNLYLDFGPVIQISDRLKVDRAQKEFLVKGLNNVTAEEIAGVSGFNFNVAAGVTFGFRQFKLRAHYQYGINNILGKLNDEGLDPDGDKFNGHISMVTGVAIFYF